MANQDTPDNHSGRTARSPRVRGAEEPAPASGALSGRTLSEFVVASAQDAARLADLPDELARKLSRYSQLPVGTR